VTAYQNQINAWLKTQSDAIYQWYLGEWNKLEAVTSNAENWVNNEIDNYDGGKWESDIELSLTGNPFDTLTDTYHNIINTLQQEGQTDLNNAATGWNTTLQAAVSDTNATIVGFWNTYNNAVATATTAANNAVAGWETQLSNDLASIASTLITETTLANTNVTNLQNGLPTALASAKASLQSESSTLQSDVPSLNKAAGKILSGLNVELAQSFISTIKANPDANPATMPGYLTTTVIADANNQLNSLFNSVI